MIPSPTALKKVLHAPSDPINQCTFNLKPVGAGPFMVTVVQAEGSHHDGQEPQLLGRRRSTSTA